ncbi:MAG TPA: FixH family protein, partial [Ktedonobacteraceae bacterium]|nr:FixH family protein [Ktedonobacteraceae bacterium]
KTSDKLFTVKVTVSPNRFGTNVFTVTVLDSKGVQDTNVGVSIYTTMLDMDMGTDTVNLQPDGKGNFKANGDLSMGGNWQLRIEVRTPDFKLHEATVKLFTPF